MTNYLATDTDLNTVAAAIRSKGGTSASLAFPAGFSSAISAIKTKEAVTWHQCPELVRNYLTNVTYDPTDYTTSQIATYAPATAVSSNTKPIGETVDGVTYYNEIPNALTPFASTNTAGTLTPLDVLRWIKTSDIEDFRDLGGWTCDGGTVKYGKLFRGSRLVDDSDLSFLLDDLKLGAELDLRYSSDIAQNPATLADYLDYLHVDGNWYTLTDTAKWKAQIQFIFDSIKQNKNVWFHCAGGLDRTGTLACVIEGMLGISQSDVDKDYELGCFYSGSGSDSTARRRNESEWQGLITALNAQTGSTFMMKCVNFVASLGFSAAEINAFRSSMIDGTPTTVTPTITNYTVTTSLTNTDIDNSASSIQKNQSYAAKVTAQSGNTLQSCSITMGGTDVTSSYLNTIVEGGLDMETYPFHGEIEIPLVTGNIAITAVSQSNARIPSEYQEVAYIESPDQNAAGTGSNAYTPCINPNLKWSEFDTIEFYGLRDAYVSYTGSSGLMILATYTGTDTRTSPYVAINDSGLKVSGVAGSLSTNYTKSQMRASDFKVMTLTLTSHSQTTQAEFGSWSDAGYCMRWQTKEQKWYLNSTLVRHLIPCYRKLDSVIGMYDLVGEIFYTNAGSGILGKGADV